MSILVAGNKNYGLANSIQNITSEAKFASRSTGYDLSIMSKQEELASESLHYDVFISVSSLYNYYQNQLIEKIVKTWYNNQHQGYILVIGSTADTPVPGTIWQYPAEKKSLRAYCRQISMLISSENPPPFRMTYLSPGNMNTPKAEEKRPEVPKLDTDYIVEIIGWLLNQPQNVNISELCLDRIQF